MKAKRKILIVAICLACVGTVLGLVFTRGAGTQATPNTVTVSRGDIVRTVLVDGNVVMPNKAYLSFGVPGSVKEILVNKGSNVTKGQVLAKLDAQSLNSSVKMAELQVKIAQEQVNAARAQYEIALINWKAAAANTTLKQVYQEQVNMAEANWEAAKLSLKVAGLNLDSAKLNLEKAIIEAPFDGMVADITIIKGQELSATSLASPAISLVNTNLTEIRGFIDEVDVALVQLGFEADILLDALPDEKITGKVSFISPISTIRAGVTSYATTVTLGNNTAGLRDGMSATAEVIIERRDGVLLIPNKAVRGSLENPKVRVLTAGQQEEREITLGLSDGTNVEVLSGLEEGEKVVLPASGEQPGFFFMS